MQRGEISPAEASVLIKQLSDDLKAENDRRSALTQYTTSWEVDWIEEQRRRGFRGFKVITTPERKSPLAIASLACERRQRGEITQDEYMAVLEQCKQEMKARSERELSVLRRRQAGEATRRDVEKELYGYSDEYLDEKERSAETEASARRANLDRMSVREVKFRNPGGH
ncbi:hypothetical protein DENSPDRAFT_294733 [Dentipellis sp. KUC8613]|nr:hypothetical protein DENSPDRAFT_294733 [Dentipellis sp. KUC8613]